MVKLKTYNINDIILLYWCSFCIFHEDETYNYNSHWRSQILWLGGAQNGQILWHCFGDVMTKLCCCHLNAVIIDIILVTLWRNCVDVTEMLS